MDILAILFPCLPVSSKPLRPSKGTDMKKEGLLSANTSTYPAVIKHSVLTAQEAADAIVDAFHAMPKPGQSLDMRVQSLIHQAGGWSEYLGTKIIAALEEALKAGREMNEAMRVAYDKACQAVRAVWGFAEDHPILAGVLCTVVAIGVLVILAPYVLEALGFGALGPVEGSWAAEWQAVYSGFVPKGSLFSYFQRLGMRWAYGPKADMILERWNHGMERWRR